MAALTAKRPARVAAPTPSAAPVMMGDMSTSELVPPGQIMTPGAKPAVEPAHTEAAVTAEAPRKTPVYKKWWFWTAIVGAAAVVAVGVGLGVALSSAPSAPANTGATDGTLRF